MSENTATGVIITDLKQPGDDITQCIRFHTNGKLDFHATLTEYCNKLKKTIEKIELLCDTISEEETGDITLCGAENDIEITAPVETMEMLTNLGLVELATESGSDNDNSDGEYEEDSENEADPTSD